jgi:hypothetical protein
MVMRNKENEIEIEIEIEIEDAFTIMKRIER